MKIETKTQATTEVTVKTTISKQHFAHIEFDEMVLPKRKFYNMVVDAAIAGESVRDFYDFKVTLSELLAEDKVCLRLNGEVVALVTEK